MTTITKSIILIDYTAENIASFIHSQSSKKFTLTQILPTSGFMTNQKTGLIHRDYLLIYEG